MEGYSRRLEQGANHRGADSGFPEHFAGGDLERRPGIRGSSDRDSGADALSGWRRLAPVFQTAAALLELSIFYYKLKRQGFAEVRRWVAGCAVAGKTRTACQRRDINSLLASVDRAAAYFPRGTHCFARAVVITRILRKWGAPAVLNIGVRTPPLSAHAWAELGDVPLGRDGAEAGDYRILDRIEPVHGGST